MLSVQDYFSEEKVEALKDLMVHSISKSDDCYSELKCISTAHLEWNEPMYERSYKHPYESLARYLYLKWGMPKQEIKFGNLNLHRPNLAVVYVIDVSLQIAEKQWKNFL